MPEQTNQPAAQDPQAAPRGTTLHVRQQDTKTSYANMCLLSSTREELILSFGLTVPSPGRQTNEATMVVSDRIVMMMPAAKRLAIALSQALRQYENAFGVIDLPQPPHAP